MGKPVAKVGDSVQYCCQIGDDIVCGTGRVAVGSRRTITNSKDQARDGDQADCGPCGYGNIIASGTTLVDGRKVALIGDRVILPTGSGTIISGSNNVDSS